MRTDAVKAAAKNYYNHPKSDILIESYLGPKKASALIANDEDVILHIKYEVKTNYAYELKYCAANDADLRNFSPSFRDELKTTEEVMRTFDTLRFRYYLSDNQVHELKQLYFDEKIAMDIK